MMDRAAEVCTYKAQWLYKKGSELTYRSLWISVIIYKLTLLTLHEGRKEKCFKIYDLHAIQEKSAFTRQV